MIITVLCQTRLEGASGLLEEDIKEDGEDSCSDMRDEGTLTWGLVMLSIHHISCQIYNVNIHGNI